MINVEKDPREFLDRCQTSRVEGRTFKYEGTQYAIPYSTIMVGGRVLQGLRENEDRIGKFRGIIEKSGARKQSYLDIGSNLGVFVHNLGFDFSDAYGLEKDEYYVNQCEFLYGDKSDMHFRHVDLNNYRLTRVFSHEKSFNVVTALSMIEYIRDKEQFVKDLCEITEDVCIVEGHSEDIEKGLDFVYEELLTSFPWTVKRMDWLTDAGINAPPSPGRPVWVCTREKNDVEVLPPDGDS